MLRQTLRLAVLLGMVSAMEWIAATVGAAEPGAVRFEKIQLTDRYYCDGITGGDINRDGQMDIVAGPFWYEGPEFKEAHEFYPAVVLPIDTTPSNSMFSFVYDFSGDGWPDILVLGRVKFHEPYWYENPATADRPWKKHYVFERVRGESPTLTDITGDGRPELLCHWEGKWGWLAPDWNAPHKPWTFHPVEEDRGWDDYYHGEGVGDLSGDGRMDILINDGWYEQPAQLTNALGPVSWTFHRGRFSQDRGGAQMFAYDVDGDGDADVITSLHAHQWGLAWYEQLGRVGEVVPPDGAEVRLVGDLVFVEHRIMGNRGEEAKYGVAFSQPHALDLADIDGDGLKDIVVGKRMWAHGPTGDVEPGASPVLYWFQLNRDGNRGVTYVPHLIDDHSGVGTQVTAMDVNGDGRTDILTVSKLGAFVFLNRIQ